MKNYCLMPIYLFCDGSLGSCDCKTRRAAALREARLLQEARRPKHGTQYTYKHCKEDNGRPCAVCRKSNAERIRAYRNNKKERTDEQPRIDRAA